MRWDLPDVYTGICAEISVLASWPPSIVQIDAKNEHWPSRPSVGVCFGTGYSPGPATGGQTKWNCPRVELYYTPPRLRIASWNHNTFGILRTDKHGQLSIYGVVVSNAVQLPQTYPGERLRATSEGGRFLGR